MDLVGRIKASPPKVSSGANKILPPGHSPSHTPAVLINIFRVESFIPWIKDIIKD